MGAGGCRCSFECNPPATPESLQNPTLGSREGAKVASRLGSPTPDSSLRLIYDPRGETKFPCPPQTAQTNETDALFIIAGAKPGAKAEKKKISEKLKKQKEWWWWWGGFLFVLPLFSRLSTPSLTPSIILAGDKRLLKLNW